MRWRGGVAITCAALVGGCALVGQGSLDMTLVEGAIRDDVVANFDGVVVDRVDCPAQRPAKRGDSFQCTALVDGQVVPFEIIQDVGTDSTEKYRSGHVDIELGPVNPRRVASFERAAAAFVLENEGVDVAADCGGPKDYQWLFIAKARPLDCVVDYGGLERGVRVSIGPLAGVRTIAFTQARLELGVVTDRVSQQLITELGGPFALDCSPTFADVTTSLALDPGARFECTAVRELVPVARLAITVVDINGRLRAEVIPGS